MFTKKLLASFVATSIACAGLSQGAVALFIDDFKDDIGDSGDGDTTVLFTNTVEAFKVTKADPSDTATVAQTAPAGTSRTALATVTSATVGSGIAGTFATFPVGALGGLAIEINDGSPDDTANFSFGYDFTPVFDATAGGLLDTVEIKVENSEWIPGKGSMFVDFIEDTSGDTATWSITPTTGVQSSTLVSLTGAGSVDFSNISDITLRFEDGYDVDITFSNFGLSGPPVPEPSSVVLALLGSGFLIARRRRR